MILESLLLLHNIFVYSCEVWGFENKQGIEKMHLQYCNRILNLRSSTPHFMVYGEIGRFPVEMSIGMAKFLIFLYKAYNALFARSNNFFRAVQKSPL
jgi:hypothetical protein